MGVPPVFSGRALPPIPQICVNYLIRDPQYIILHESDKMSNLQAIFFDSNQPRMLLSFSGVLKFCPSPFCQRLRR
jgi:hypothetical protein